MCQHPDPNSMTKGRENSDWQLPLEPPIGLWVGGWCAGRKQFPQFPQRRMACYAGTTFDVRCKELKENIRQGKFVPGSSTFFASPTPSSQSPNVSPAAHPQPKVRNTLFLPGSTFFLTFLNPPPKDASSPRNVTHGVFMLWNARSYSEKVRPSSLLIRELLDTVPTRRHFNGQYRQSLQHPIFSQLLLPAHLLPGTN